jgi:hypothetical protein
MAASSKQPDKSKAASTDKKVFDVAKPGKSAPDTTTRPIIVGHKPMIQDPMVNNSEPNAAETPQVEEEKAVSNRSAKKIAPLSDQKPEDQAEPLAQDAPVDSANDLPEKPIDEPAETATNPEASEPEETQEEKPTDTESKPETPAENSEEKLTAQNDEGPASNDAAVMDALANEATKKKEGQLTEEEKQKAEAISKLIAEKTYYVRTGQAHHKRNATLFILLGVVVLVLIGGVLAIDAGLIDLNITLPFDLFPN